MITTQHIAPTYRPPANHWLRQILASQRRRRCLQTCVNNELEVITTQIVPVWGEFKANLPHGGTPLYTLGMTMSTQEIVGSNPIADIFFRLSKDSDRTYLALYSDDGFDPDEIVLTYDLPYLTDELQMEYAGSDFGPGLTSFKATFHNIINGNGNVMPASTSYEFYIRKEMLPSDPTVIAPENHLAKMTKVINTGNYRLDIFEGNALVATIPAYAPAVILPMPGRLPISAKVSAGQNINEGQYGIARVERSLRCLCGDVIVEPEPIPVGGDLV